MCWNKVLQWMDASHLALVKLVPQPERIQTESGICYRYTNDSAEQASIQKLARIVSGLRASLIFLEYGHLQEQVALCRMVDEYQEDVVFLAFGILDGELSDLHVQYLAAFNKEEVRPTGSKENWSKGRNWVSRKRIRAFIANHIRSVGNPSDLVSVSALLSNVYSGYVHAASTQVMEMYDPETNSFLTSGMNGTRFKYDHSKDIRNYFIRGVLAFGFAALALGDRTIYNQARDFDTKLNH